MIVLQAYRFALDPTLAQVAGLRSHCGAQRYAYNWGLALIKANLGQRGAEKSYGIADTKLTPSVSWSAYSLRKQWNQTKDAVAPWWGENSKEAYSSGLANLATALGNWNTSNKDKRMAAKVRFPTFKGKHAGLSSTAVGGGCGSGCDVPGGALDR
ncbi:helix-turn-helix domain-containing protein [Actinokineospora sp.]|uniref:helix-turn-helix domain-containing protein n=1 Tax=Actinokineospora sp. TaxID=1872133 RepID=UPI003D6A4C72